MYSQKKNCKKLYLIRIQLKHGFVPHGVEFLFTGVVLLDAILLKNFQKGGIGHLDAIEEILRRGSISRATCNLGVFFSKCAGNERRTFIYKKHVTTYRA